MYCRYCMKKIDDNDKKCKSCGKDLTPIDSKEMKYCKYCYTYNQKDAKYCYKCSADLPDKTITKRNNSSIVIGIVISTLVYFLIYKLTNMKLVAMDVILYLLLTYIVCDWIYWLMNKRVLEKNNNHIERIAFLRDIRRTFNPVVEVGQFYLDYDKDVKSTVNKIENKLYRNYLFYHIRFIGKIAFFLFLLMVIHFPQHDNLIAISILFSIATNIIF